MVKPVKRRRFGRRKVCKFCVDKIEAVDYRDIKRVRTFVTERGKIIPRRISGSERCAVSFSSISDEKLMPCSVA